MSLKKIIISTAILIILLAGIIFIDADSHVKDRYSYTKAICNEKNFCQDHIIYCENKNVVSVTPITGATIQLPINWQDTRENKSEIICD